jgi:tRNA(fMet)-specific endonuclease VapC
VKYLLDTNVISEPMKRRPSAAVLRRLTEQGHLCAVCAPVWHELAYGIARQSHPDRKRYLEELRASLRVLPYDQRAADWHAEERARLERAGATPSFVDGMIAAITASNGLVLVTRNVTHFRQFRSLEVERW